MNKFTFIFISLLLTELISCHKSVDPVFLGPLLTKEVETAPYAEYLRLFTYNKAGQLIFQNQQPTPNGQTPGYERNLTYDQPGGKLSKVEEWGLFVFPGTKKFQLKTTYEYNLDRTLKLTIDSIVQNGILQENKRVLFSYVNGRLISQTIYTHEYVGGGFVYSAPVTTYFIKRAIIYNLRNLVTAEVDSVWGLTSVENFDYNPIRAITPKLKGVYKNNYTYNIQGDIESEIKYFPSFSDYYTSGELITYTYVYNSKNLPVQINKMTHPINSTPQTYVINRTYSD